MIFTLEALQAKHGDSLLLHFGEGEPPSLIVIDGGPPGVYRRTLLPRLRSLRQSRGLSAEDDLPIRMLMVSHVDDDHIRGVVDFTNDLVERSDDQEPLQYRIRTLWVNTFDDIVGDQAEALWSAARADVGAASLSGEIRDDLPISRPGALVLASVPQGRTVRNNARRLALSLNAPHDGPVLAVGETPFDVGDGLQFRVLGPGRTRLEKLQREWDEELRRRGLARETERTAETAAYVDGSVYNLASIVVLAEAGGRRILLTGDARGDDILAGLREAGLLDNGRIHVDILKLPHHGSDRNVETDFFRKVTADHYVISGDGRHGNPEIATFEMILNARGNAQIDLHLTYPIEEFTHDYPIAALQNALESRRQAGARFRIHTPAEGASGLRIDLLDPYDGS
jgi:hypothetical protein